MITLQHSKQQQKHYTILLFENKLRLTIQAVDIMNVGNNFQNDKYTPTIYLHLFIHVLQLVCSDIMELLHNDIFY